jgi:hypothetical protein
VPHIFSTLSFSAFLRASFFMGTIITLAFIFPGFVYIYSWSSTTSKRRTFFFLSQNYVAVLNWSLVRKTSMSPLLATSLYELIMFTKLYLPWFWLSLLIMMSSRSSVGRERMLTYPTPILNSLFKLLGCIVKVFILSIFLLNSYYKNGRTSN